MFQYHDSLLHGHRTTGRRRPSMDTSNRVGRAAPSGVVTVFMSFSIPSARYILERMSDPVEARTAVVRSERTVRKGVLPHARST